MPIAQQAVDGLTSVKLLAWYDVHGRELPWRMKGGRAADPYRVWLSEIMLQQTTVAAVIPYFETFTSIWPTLPLLAAAPLDDVLKRWAGLGYYSRARNLHACAQAVMHRHGGAFPAEEAALLALPGIGAYTAAAIAAIGFGQRAVVVDGNVDRVMTRLTAIDAPVSQAKPLIRAAMDQRTPARRAGDFAQAVMDLGATICTPRSPSCLLCPLADECVAHKQGRAELFPIKAPKKPKPERQAVAFVAFRPDGTVLMRQRAAKGLLGGMLELPATGWDSRAAEGFDLTGAFVTPPFAANWNNEPLSIRHVFTHFALTLHLRVTHVSETHATPDGFAWVVSENSAVPTLFQKAIDAARESTLAVGNPKASGEKRSKSR